MKRAKIDRDKLYSFYEITKMWREKHGHTKQRVKIDSNGKRKILNNTSGLDNAHKSTSFKKACKELDIDLKAHNIKRFNRVVNAISMSQWELIRARIISNMSATPANKANLQIYLKNDRCYINILDYFFKNLKEYEAQKSMTNERLNQAFADLLDVPKDSEQRFLATRIFKGKALDNFLQTAHAIYTNDVTYSGRLKVKEKGNIKLAFMFVGSLCVQNKPHRLITIRQLKAIRYIMKYHISRKHFDYMPEYIEAGLRSIDRFLQEQERYQERYDVEYVENKVYKSLWL